MAAKTFTNSEVDGAVVEETLSSTAGNRRRIVMPTAYSHAYLHIFAPSGGYVRLERGDFADDTAADADDYEEIAAGTSRVCYIGRGECAISSDASSAEVKLAVVTV